MGSPEILVKPKSSRLVTELHENPTLRGKSNQLDYCWPHKVRKTETSRAWIPPMSRSASDSSLAGYDVITPTVRRPAARAAASPQRESSIATHLRESNSLPVFTANSASARK